MRRAPTSAIIVVLFMAGVSALAQPLVPDGNEAQAWRPWGDEGDADVALSQTDELASDGAHSLRVAVTLGPGATFWPALGFDLPADAALGVPMLRVMLHVPDNAGALPPGTVSVTVLQADRRLSSAVLNDAVAGEWNALDVGLAGLGDLADGPVRLKLAFRPDREAAGPETFVFHIDGPFLAELEAGGGHEPYEQVSDLNLDTPLTRGGRPVAAIVAPDDGRYADAVAAIQQAIRERAGCELPVVSGESLPAEVLAGRPVIALGNMAASPFMYEFYREYYTWLDLKYPGPGGSVVRSVHDPYATGHNVILVGGSDDAGVLAAARKLAAILPDARDLTLGWLMEIELGEGMEPPAIGETVYGWRDSHRQPAEGAAVGYDPTTYFGWNPISTQAALYFMTGEEPYLHEFVRLALPEPGNVPEEVRTSEAFYSMEHPLVENYHYRAHVMDLVWDLIEESPLLDDATRLAITNELRAHQDFIDAEDDLAPTTGSSRHGSYDLLCIHTGSRYFAKHYPAPRWKKRLDNCRQAFSWWTKHATWGENDSLFWVNTSIEPVLEYWHLADPATYVNSGMAATMMRSQEMLWTGQTYEMNNRSQTLSLMHRASWLLADGSYAWLVRQAGFDLERFRIGQSWWPGPQIEVAAPTAPIGRVSVMPLANPLAERVRAPFSGAEGYQFLSYRTGLGPEDGYFLLDGHDGGGRNPHHVSSLNFLRLTGRKLCEGYENMVTVLRDGMSETAVARAARLDGSVALDGYAWVRSTVPNEAFSSWQRDLLWADDRFVLVADSVTAREEGEFEVACRWRPMGPGILGPEGVFGGQNSGGSHATYVCAQPASIAIRAGTLTQQRNVRLVEGERLGFINICYAEEQARGFRLRMLPLGESAALITGDERGLVSVGSFADQETGLAVEAEVALVTEDAVCLMNATRFACAAGEIASEQPISLVWRLAEGRLTVEGGPEPALPEAEATRAAIGDALSALIERTPVPATPEPPQLAARNTLEPSREIDLGAPVTHVIDAGGTLWAATEQPALHLVGPGGDAPERTIELPAKLNALVAAPPDAPGGVRVIGGGDDDMLRAWDAQGELLWERPSHVSDTFKVGDRYQAPWFTDPAVKPGILSLMIGDVTGTGKPEIVVGRPSTVEYWSLAGELLARLPVQWGDVRELALVQLDGGPRVLAGKHVSGHSNVSVLGPDRALITNVGFAGIRRGSTQMQAWLQWGIGAVLVADLNGDGSQEVVVANTGHWNDVRAFDAAGPEPRWQVAFGAGRPQAHFIRDVLVGDFTPAEGLETIAGMQNGWVVCIAASGEVLWSRRLDGGVTRLADVAGSVVVAVDSGSVYMLGDDGAVDTIWATGGAVRDVVVSGETIFAGAADGKLMALKP